jgi:hypothetical protein
LIKFFTGSATLYAAWEVSAGGMTYLPTSF